MPHAWTEEAAPDYMGVSGDSGTCRTAIPYSALRILVTLNWLAKHGRTQAEKRLNWRVWSGQNGLMPKAGVVVVQDNRAQSARQRWSVLLGRR